MVLAMPRPVKHPTTGVYLFRRRVPQHLRGLVGKAEVKRSLGTKDPSKAKRLYLETAEAVDREWALLGTAPVVLSHKEIMRLAGVAYRDFIGIHPDNPGPASVWMHHIRLSEEARAKGKLDQWVGPYVDAQLVREGIKTTAECRLKVEGRKSIAERKPATVEPARKLARARPKGGKRSLREISAALAEEGHTTKAGTPCAATAIKLMLGYG